MKKRRFNYNGDVHFIADTHFSHGNIIKYCNRPFLTDVDRQALEENEGTWEKSKYRLSREAIELMDDTIIGNINKCVGVDSILFHLGDFAMPGRQHDYFYRCKYYRNRINCSNIVYIFGNHDGEELEQLFPQCFDLMSDVVINHQQFSLCHYAQVVWNKNHGKSQSIGLHGHSHSSAEPWIDLKMPGHRSMDVGIDNAYKLLGEYRPFSFQEIMEIMSKRKGFFMDHHI